MSYLWYGPLGCLSTVVIGMLVSLMTGRNRGQDINPKLMYPLFANLLFCFPLEVRKKLWFGVRYDHPESVTVVHQRVTTTNGARKTIPTAPSNETPAKEIAKNPISRSQSLYTVNSHSGVLEANPGLVEYEIKVSVC